MFVTSADRDRIAGLGHRGFVELRTLSDPENTPEAFLRGTLGQGSNRLHLALAKKDGRCVFLDSNGACSLGPSRPSVCKAAPLIPLRTGQLATMYEPSRCLALKRAGAGPKGEIATASVLSGVARELGTSPGAMRRAADRWWEGK